MTFNDIIKVLPSTAYVKLRVDGGEVINQVRVYKNRGNSYFNKKKVIMIRPYCISEQEAYYYDISPAMLDITLK